MLDNLPATSVPARTLGEFAGGLAFEHIPDAVLERAKLLILDALGCGIASNAYGFSDATLAGAIALGGVGQCSVIGRANRLPVRDAALVNGMLIHGLDFADTHLASIVHATAACLPTALTFGEELGVDGRGLLVAYAAGMETAIRIGAAAKGGFHHTGFHATGVVAHFSASVVAARLLDLPSEAIVAAQGIAASTASGVQVFLEEGAWTKRMHPGWAAVAGITAARLAQYGFKAPTRPYEGKFGFFDTTSSTRRRRSTSQPSSPLWGLSGNSRRPPSSPIRSATSSMAAPMRPSGCTMRSTAPISSAPRPFCHARQCPSSPSRATARSAPLTNTRPSSVPRSSSPPAS